MDEVLIKNDKRIDGGKMLLITKEGERLYDTNDFTEPDKLISILKP